MACFIIVAIECSTGELNELALNDMDDSLSIDLIEDTQAFWTEISNLIYSTPHYDWSRSREERFEQVQDFFYIETFKNDDPTLLTIRDDPKAFLASLEA